MSLRWKTLCIGICLCSVAQGAPLLTEDYPLWVRDAVFTLREKGLISAGCLPQQAVGRSEMTPIFERWLELQTRQEADLASKEEAESLRQLLESFRQSLDQLEQRVEPLEKP